MIPFIFFLQLLLLLYGGCDQFFNLKTSNISGFIDNLSICGNFYAFRNILSMRLLKVDHFTCQICVQYYY